MTQKRGKHLLTARAVKTAKPESKEVVLNDGGGLVLRIRPTGKRTWRFRYMLNLKSRVMDLGDGEALSLAEARDAAAEARKLIDKGICPIEHREAEKARAEAEKVAQVTLADAVQDWFTLVLVNRSESGRRDAERSVRKDILATLGERPLQSIRRADLVRQLDLVAARGSPRMANRLLSDMKQFLAWAEVRELIDRNPLANVSKAAIGGAEVERDRVLNPEEIRALRDALPGSGLNERFQLALWILLGTGARVGELIQSRWEHIDLDTGTWYLPTTKNGCEHTIHLSRFATRHFEQLRALTSWSSFVMPSNRTTGDGQDRHIYEKAITTAIRDRRLAEPNKGRPSKYAGTLALPGGGWTPHDLRRTAATIMADQGVLPDIIERCLNHTEQNRIKRTYQRHDYMDERRDAFNRLGTRLEEILSGNERKVLPFKSA